MKSQVVGGIMDKETLSKLIDELDLKEHIEFESIPNLDLYMDQVITLFEDKLSHTKRHEDDKLLTKTMINNYTKDKLLMPAVKKKYTKEHIILMILLYELKQILTIGDIKALFGTLIQGETIDSQLLETIYKTYLNLQQKNVMDFKKEVEEGLENLTEAVRNETPTLAADIKDNDKVQDVLTAIMLVEKGNYYKRLAEKIIDKRIHE